MQSANSTTSTTEQKKDIRQQKKHTSRDEAYHKIEAYGDIKLIFGKHKGKTLDELKDTQTDYLFWLLDAMTNDVKKKSPTQIAIMKYIKHCV